MAIRVDSMKPEKVSYDSRRAPGYALLERRKKRELLRNVLFTLLFAPAFGIALVFIGTGSLEIALVAISAIPLTIFFLTVAVLS